MGQLLPGIIYFIVLFLLPGLLDAKPKFYLIETETKQDGVKNDDIPITANDYEESLSAKFAAKHWDKRNLKTSMQAEPKPLKNQEDSSWDFLAWMEDEIYWNENKNFKDNQMHHVRFQGQIIH